MKLKSTTSSLARAWETNLTKKVKKIFPSSLKCQKLWGSLSFKWERSKKSRRCWRRLRKGFWSKWGSEKC
jgi:hypothetical protein